SASLNRASNLADWLVKNQQDGVWYINFPNSYYKIDAPWPSAMVQGQAIALLSRIALVTRKREYLDIAILALQPFGRSSDKGGVLIHTESGDFYEEFPSSPPSMVLNGFIFSLIGLYDLWAHHRVGEAERLFEAGFKTLIKIIDRYDTGFWTRYDLYPIKRLSSQEYHSLHISLLESLLKIAFEQKIVDIIKKWRCYRNNILCQTSWLIHKLKEKMKDSSYTSTLKLRIR
ncbi:MAG: D-glucuronyl C5-epimerase family protein, partial [candidate division WOR-3 bacterium]